MQLTTDRMTSTFAYIVPVILSLTVVCGSGQMFKIFDAAEGLLDEKWMIVVDSVKTIRQCSFICSRKTDCKSALYFHEQEVCKLSEQNSVLPGNADLHNYKVVGISCFFFHCM